MTNDGSTSSPFSAGCYLGKVVTHFACLVCPLTNQRCNPRSLLLALSPLSKVFHCVNGALECVLQHGGLLQADTGSHEIGVHPERFGLFYQVSTRWILAKYHSHPVELAVVSQKSIRGTKNRRVSMSRH